MQTRAIAYRATHEALPLFGVYALLFADRGLSVSQITVLLVVWSVTTFLLEIPSGAWADLVDRRRMLVASGVVYTAAFSTWMLWPTFWGFLVGFVLWSLSDAMHSGTFEAYLFEQLQREGRADRYAATKARAESVALLGMAAAIAAAAPLHGAGGYDLVLGVTLAVTVVHVAVTLALPRPGPGAPGPAAAPGGPLPEPAPAPAEVGPQGAPSPVDPGDEPVSVGAWWRTLRAGVREAARRTAVRRILLAYAAVVALVGFDEYFALLFRAGGASVQVVAWVIAGVALVEAAATWLADRTATLSGAGHATLVALAGLLLAGGAWWSGPVSFVAVAAGYALASSAYTAGDIRLQHAMSGAARATVTSVAGVVAELGFLATLALVGLATLRWDLSPVVAVAALVLTVPAALSAARAPAAPRVVYRAEQGRSAARDRAGGPR